MITVTRTKKPPSAKKVIENIFFGTAVGLTKTAKEAQGAVIKATASGFNVRGSWLKEGGKFGVKVKPATKTNTVAEVLWNADWIEKQKKGGTITSSTKARTYRYTYAGTRYIAIPSRALRPKGSKKVIPRSQWPSSLRRKKSTHVVISKKSKTPLVISRYGPGKDQYEVMYILKPDVSIKAKDTFADPIEKVVKRRGASNINREVENALRNIK